MRKLIKYDKILDYFDSILIDNVGNIKSLNTGITYDVIDDAIILFDDLENLDLNINKIKNKHKIDDLYILYILRFICFNYHTHLKNDYLKKELEYINKVYDYTNNKNKLDYNTRYMLQNYTNGTHRYYLFKPSKEINYIEKGKYIDDYYHIIDCDKFALIETYNDSTCKGFGWSFQDLIEYAIIHKEWEFFEYFLYHENIVCLLIITKILFKYLSLLPYNIMQKILRIYRYTQHNKMYYIKSSYYISYKLGYTEFIDFDELDEFYINKLKYCVYYY